MSSSIKKTLVMSATALAVLTANAVMAEASIYGKLNLSVQKIDTEAAGVDTQDNFEVLSNASRLGFKGDAEITEGLKAVTKIEYEVAGDGEFFGAGSDSPFKSRNVYVGLAGNSWGSFILGRQDTPVKSLGKNVEAFNDYYLGDIKNVVEGENRVSNMMKYQTPRWVGIQTTLMLVQGEEDGVDDPATPGVDESKDSDNGIGDGVSTTVDYKMESFKVGVGYDSNVDGRNLVRLAASASFGDVTVGALVQNSEDEDSAVKDDEAALVASVAWKISNWKLKAQYGMSDIDQGNPDDVEKTLMVVGADYKLAKTTKVYGYFANTEEDDNGVEESEDTFGLGVEHKF